MFAKRKLAPSVFYWVLLASLLANILALASSLYSIQVFNRYIGYGLDGTLVALTTGALLAIALEFVLRSIRTKLVASIVNPQDAQDNYKLLQHLLRVQPDVMAQQPPQMVFQTMKQQQQIQQSYSTQNWLSLIDLPFALIFIAAIYLLLPTLGVIVSLAAALSLVVLWWWHKRSLAQQFSVQQANQRYEASIGRSASHNTIAAFNAAPYIEQQHQQPLIEWLRQRAQLSAQQASMQQSTQLISSVTSVSVICIGAIAVTQGGMDIGSLIGANILAARGIAMINQAAKASQQIDQSQPLVEALSEAKALTQTPDTGAAPTQYQGNIAIKGLSHSYDPRMAPFLNNFNVSVVTGDSLVIVGNNGSGKSTLAKVLLGLVTPMQGQVLVDGVDLRQLQLAWWRSQVAYVPQEPVLLNASLLDNLTILRWPETVAEDSLRQVVEQCGLQSWVDKHPDGLNQAIVAGGANLPMGIRKRIALARALLGEAKLLVFDEVHEGLDAAGRTLYADLLKQQQQAGKTLVIFSTDAQIFAGQFNSFDLNTGRYTKARVRGGS